MTVIEFDQIRVGDTVRRDLEGIASAMTVAKRDKVRVYPNDVTCLMDHDGSVWTLVDRPTPAVELPTEPTLGWVSWWGPRHPGYSYPALETICAGTDKLEGKVWREGREDHPDPSELRSFTPATAVPTEALADLRAAAGGMIPGPTRQFLAAVDAAGGAA